MLVTAAKSIEIVVNIANLVMELVRMIVRLVVSITRLTRVGKDLGKPLANANREWENYRPVMRVSIESAVRKSQASQSVAHPIEIPLAVKTAIAVATAVDGHISTEAVRSAIECSLAKGESTVWRHKRDNIIDEAGIVDSVELEIGHAFFVIIEDQLANLSTRHSRNSQDLIVAVREDFDEHIKEVQAICKPLACECDQGMHAGIRILEVLLSYVCKSVNEIDADVIRNLMRRISEDTRSDIKSQIFLGRPAEYILEREVLRIRHLLLSQIGHAVLPRAA